jgi:hypothetical protein
MITLSYQTICISAVVILIVGIIIGTSSRSPKEKVEERAPRRVWVEFSEDELKELGKHKQVDDLEEAPALIKQKLTRDITFKDMLLDDNDEDPKRTRRKNRGN